MAAENEEETTSKAEWIQIVCVLACFVGVPTGSFIQWGLGGGIIATALVLGAVAILLGFLHQ